MADMNKPTIQKTRNSLRVKVDVARNRLYIFIAGEITKKSLDQFFTEVRFGIADLKPEYNIITDLTQCHIGHLSAIPTFRKIMHYVSSHGVKDIIRVVNSKNLIYRQAINLASQIQGYSPMYVSSMDEAEELLDGKMSRDSLRFNLLNRDITVTTKEFTYSGKISNLSTSGCAIRSDKTVPLGQKNACKTLSH